MSSPLTIKNTDGYTTRFVCAPVRTACVFFFNALLLRCSKITGFNHFIENLLPEIVRENSDIVVEQNGRRHMIRFGDVTIKKPTVDVEDGKQVALSPFEARVRRLTYSLSVTGNLLHEIHALYEGGRSELLQRNEAIEVRRSVIGIGTNRAITPFGAVRGRYLFFVYLACSGQSFAI